MRSLKFISNTVEYFCIELCYNLLLNNNPLIRNGLSSLKRGGILFNTTFDRRIFDISSPRNAIKGQIFSPWRSCGKVLKVGGGLLFSRGLLLSNRLYTFSISNVWIHHHLSDNRTQIYEVESRAGYPESPDPARIWCFCIYLRFLKFYAVSEAIN